MKPNEGWAERLARLVVGVALLGLAFSHVVGGKLAIAAYIVGGIALITGLVGYCPAWSIFGINTCHVTSHVSGQKPGAPKPA